MSAPPLFRLVDERRVSVVRDAATWLRSRFSTTIPSAACMVASRVAEHGIDPPRSAANCGRGAGPSESLCFAGANLIPLRGGLTDLNAFADKAMSTARRCSSLVGRAELVLPMWQRLEHAWGPARDVRDASAADGAEHRRRSAPIDPAVRPVRIDELDAYLVAAIDMFIGEVGIDPRTRRRRPRLPAAGRRA